MSVDKSEPVFVDTNILLYANAPDQGQKYELAKELLTRLWTDGNGVISTQVLQEFFVNLSKHRSTPLDPATARAAVENLLTWTVIVNDGRSVLDAIDIQSRYRLSFWDALIVQAAERAGATQLYSEDLNEQHYGEVEVINPLAPTRAHDVDP